MKKCFTLLLLAILFNSRLSAQATYHTQAYLDKNGAEFVIAWDSKTGKSVIYNFSGTDAKYVPIKEEYQLPQPAMSNPAGTTMLQAYLDKNGEEFVIAFDAKGNSIIYHFSPSEGKYVPIRPEYQLPQPALSNPEGVVTLQAYLDKNGSEFVIACDSKTGRNIIYNFSSSEGKYLPIKDEYQLPKLPF
jgi:hypothetical protein